MCTWQRCNRIIMRSKVRTKNVRSESGIYEEVGFSSPRSYQKLQLVNSVALAFICRLSALGSETRACPVVRICYGWSVFFFLIPCKSRSLPQGRLFSWCAFGALFLALSVLVSIPTTEREKLQFYTFLRK